MSVHGEGDVVAQRYRVDGVIGEGGAAITYAATMLDSGAAVVLKQLRLWRERDWKSLDLFQRECAVLREITHPGVPRYIDNFEVEGGDGTQFYVVQERAPGWSLAGWFAQGTPFSEAQVRLVADQVLDILSYLHGRATPVIHRDIKPQNLIMSREGRVYLVDFGAVRAHTAVANAGTTVVGTFGYMAPEQLRGVALPATDLYSLGVTLLQLLTGRRPDQLEGDATVRVPKNLPVSANLRRWLERMVAPDPKHRFPTAAVARRELTHPTRQAVKRPLRVALVTVVASAVIVPAAAYVALQFPVRAESSVRRPRIFDPVASTGRLHLDRTLSGHWNSVFGVALSNDEKSLYSCSNDGSVRRWRIPSWTTDLTYVGNTVRANVVRISADSKTLVTANLDGTIRVWDANARRPIREMNAHHGQITGLAISEDGKRIYSAGFDRRVAARNLQDGTVLWEHSMKDALYALALAPDGKQVAVADKTGVIHLLYAETGTAGFTLGGHEKAVGKLVYSGDGATLISAGDDHRVGVWHVSAHQRIRWLHGHDDEVWSVAVSPDGKLIVSGGKDGRVRLWDMYSGDLLDSVGDNPGGVMSLSFSPTGAGFAAGLGSGAVRIYSLQTPLWEPPEIKTPTPRPPFAPESGSSPVAAAVQEANYVMDAFGERGYSRARIQELLDRATKADPNYAPLAIAKARFVQQSGYLYGRKYTPESLRTASALLDEAEKMDPKLGQVWIERGHLALLDKDIPRAKECAARAAKLKVHPHRLLRLEASIAERERRWDDVHAAARRLLESKPVHRDRVNAYSDLADVFNRRDATAPAERMHRSLINLEPDSGWARGNFSYRLTQWGRYDDAIAMGLEARKVHDFPRLRIILAEAYAGKAWTLALQGEVAKAEKSLADAEDETDQIGMVHVARGAIREEKGDSVGAREAYKRGLEIEPDLKTAKQALKRLGG
ncbi:MAG: protein kinase [Polyangiaceae bacterium]